MLTTRTPTLPGRQRRLLLPNPDDPLGLFGDGPPTWIINRGKPGQRPSFSAGEATQQRDATVSKLRWHANHVTLATGKQTPTSLAALALADKLDACAPPQRPCLSGACPVCMRAQQRWFVKDTMHVLRPGVRDPRLSSPSTVVGAGVREDSRRLAQYVRQRQVSRRHPRRAQGLRDRPLQAGPRRQLKSTCRASRAPGSGNCNFGASSTPRRNVGGSN